MSFAVPVHPILELLQRRRTSGSPPCSTQRLWSLQENHKSRTQIVVQLAHKLRRLLLFLVVPYLLVILLFLQCLRGSVSAEKRLDLLMPCNACLQNEPSVTTNL